MIKSELSTVMVFACIRFRWVDPSRPEWRCIRMLACARIKFFLCELDMKPNLYLLEISILSFIVKFYQNSEINFFPKGRTT